MYSVHIGWPFIKRKFIYVYNKITLGRNAKCEELCTLFPQPTQSYTNAMRYSENRKRNGTNEKLVSKPKCGGIDMRLL